MIEVVAKLIFLLITQRWEESDRRRELVVAESLKSRDGKRSRAEGKCQGESECRIPLLRQVQRARVKDESSEPRRTERIRVAHCRVPIIVMRGQPGGRQGPLLYEIVTGQIAVFGNTQEPLRTLRLRPVESRRAEIV